MEEQSEDHTSERRTPTECAVEAIAVGLAEIESWIGEANAGRGIPKGYVLAVSKARNLSMGDRGDAN